MQEQARHKDIQCCKDWIKSFVIGRNICPFAEQPFHADQINYIWSDQDQFIPLVNLIKESSDALLAQAHYETAFLILPQLDLPFEGLYDFVTDIQENAFGTASVDIELVVFHPDFYYGGSDPEDPTNATNRSPLPMIHLLRQSSLEKIRNSNIDINQILETNKKTLRAKS